MPLLAPVTSAAEFSMAPKVPAKPAWWQAAAAFQPVRTPNFAERTVARHNPVTNTRRAHRRRSGRPTGPDDTARAACRAGCSAYANGPRADHPVTGPAAGIRRRAAAPMGRGDPDAAGAGRLVRRIRSQPPPNCSEAGEISFYGRRAFSHALTRPRFTGQRWLPARHRAHRAVQGPASR